MTKIISYNVNGIRAAIKKGFMEWLDATQPDILCLQETKAQNDQIPILLFEDLGYHSYWYSAKKKGYSSVAILSKKKPKNIIYGCGIKDYDDEGRYIQADFENLSVVSAYFPSGTSGEERQAFKYRFLNDMYDHLVDLLKTQPNLVVSGDYNICHQAIDIHNPVSNKNSSGFLPEEREWMTKFLEKAKFIDSFRYLNPEPHHYSWWSYRANARSNNKGWRIDYHMVSEALRSSIKRASILPEAKHSDHCPIVLELG